MPLFQLGLPARAPGRLALPARLSRSWQAGRLGYQARLQCRRGKAPKFLKLSTWLLDTHTLFFYGQMIQIVVFINAYIHFLQIKSNKLIIL